MHESLQYYQYDYVFNRPDKVIVEIKFALITPAILFDMSCTGRSTTEVSLMTVNAGNVQTRWLPLLTATVVEETEVEEDLTQESGECEFPFKF